MILPIRPHHNLNITQFLKRSKLKLELKNIIPELNNSLDRLDNIMEMLEELVYSQVNQYKLPSLSKLPKNKGEKKGLKK